MDRSHNRPATEGPRGTVESQDDRIVVVRPTIGTLRVPMASRTDPASSTVARHAGAAPKGVTAHGPLVATKFRAPSWVSACRQRPRALAVMLTAVAVLTFRAHAFPAWLGWLSLLAAVAQLVPVLGIVVDSGPLAADGWLVAYMPYPLYVVWLACATVAMVVRIGKPSPAP